MMGMWAPVVCSLARIEIDVFALERVDRFLSVASRNHGVAALLQQSNGELLVDGVVFS